MRHLICKECGQEREVGRRLCRSCNSKRIMEYPRYMWTKICEACKSEFEAGRKNQKICRNCYRDMQCTKSLTKNTNQYIWRISGKKHEHRAIAEEILGRLLKTNEVVHHLNDDPKDNQLENLLVLDRRIHGKLHLFLDQQRVILEKSKIENIENCWKTLIIPMTTTWLETANVKVIKLWEIGQSAAEPLLNGEGSETMHDASETDNAVEDDIVQTTTIINTLA